MRLLERLIYSTSGEAEDDGEPLLARFDVADASNLRSVRHRIRSLATTIEAYAEGDKERRSEAARYNRALVKIRDRVDAVDHEIDALRRDLDLFDGNIEHMHEA